MHAVSTNQIADILNFDDNSVYHARGVTQEIGQINKTQLLHFLSIIEYIKLQYHMIPQGIIKQC